MGESAYCAVLSRVIAIRPDFDRLTKVAAIESQLLVTALHVPYHSLWCGPRSTLHVPSSTNNSTYQINLDDLGVKYSPFAKFLWLTLDCARLTESFHVSDLCGQLRNLVVLNVALRTLHQLLDLYDLPRMVL